ncbi:unnamed protein product [Paramecium sonneborni]|uniref:Transmembrane protein n=1 Tax=Paramecium sonneborni TaxID=65129 RepID=A0A8S1PID4_9CILI|nr:unnamed protein product [Paramecium sonneborni]
MMRVFHNLKKLRQMVHISQHALNHNLKYQSQIKIIPQSLKQTVQRQRKVLTYLSIYISKVYGRMSKQFFQFGNEVFTFSHQSTLQLDNLVLFCDSYYAEIRTYNVTLENSQTSQMQFNISHQGNAQISLKNILISKSQCHYLCASCFGPEFNQCIKCFDGTSQNGVCNQCPQNMVLIPKVGCRDACDYLYPFYSNNQCQYYPSLVLLFADYHFLSERPKMQILQDFKNTDQQPIFFSYE